jgi:hypothetical protein
MRIYQVHFISSEAENESLGYGYFTTMRKAAAAHRENNPKGQGESARSRSA